MSKTKRWKDREDFTVDEMIEAQAARRRGERFRVETAEYRRARAVALEAAGLERDDDREVALEDMTAEEHMARKQRAPKW